MHLDMCINCPPNNQQGDKQMYTITIESTEVGVPNISYTSAEVSRFIEKAKDHDYLHTRLTDTLQEIRNIRNHVRDFFSEVEWEDGEKKVQKSDVNSLLESIGSDKLISTYGGSFVITGTFQVDAEDAEEAESKFAEGVDVRFNEGDILIDDVIAEDVEENY